MMFQVLNKEKVAITLNELDKSAADFWGVEMHKTKYAAPKEYNSLISNWFDVIGFAITQQGNYTKGWKNVAIYLLEDLANKTIDFNKPGVNVVSKEDHAKNYGLIEFYKPYIALMDHWDKLGYTPKKL